MLICEVIGHVWATKKDPAKAGMKLMIVRNLTPEGAHTDQTYVAADVVGAGIGEKVLVVTGSTARRALGKEEPPIDSAIVGIIDSVEA